LANIFGLVCGKIKTKILLHLQIQLLYKNKNVSHTQMATTTTSKKFNTFLSRPLQDCELNDVPGVGQATLLKLLQNSMDTPEKLMGAYLLNTRNAEKMQRWLISNCGLRMQEARKIAEALDRKAHSQMMCC
jgi:hypothetical protein